MVERMAAHGWKQVPSTQGHAVSPEIAPHWQRWQGDGVFDWVELPASMPVRLVYATIVNLTLSDTLHVPKTHVL